MAERSSEPAGRAGSGARASGPVCLVGLRCAGKSTLGPALAAALGVPFHDLDDELAADWAAAEPGRAPAPAGAILAREGAARFRALEAAALARLLDRRRPAVIATGAGCVETPLARELLRSRTCTLWLEVGEAELARRMRADPTPRPALLGADPIAEIPLVAARREPLYREVAHAVLACGSDPIDRLVERALTLLESA